MTPILTLLMTENWVAFVCMMFMQSFMKICQLLKVIRVDRHRHTAIM